jgi:hypothetical protein
LRTHISRQSATAIVGTLHLGEKFSIGYSILRNLLSRKSHPGQSGAIFSYAEIGNSRYERKKSGSCKAADFLFDYCCYEGLFVGTAETTSQWTQHDLSITAPNEGLMTVIESEAHILRVRCAQDQI